MKNLNWNKTDIPDIEKNRIRDAVFDMNVMGGAGRVIQRALNDFSDAGLAIDGKIGQKTIDALNSIPEDKISDFMEELKEERIEYLQKTTNWSTAKGGWTKQTTIKYRFLTNATVPTHNHQYILERQLLGCSLPVSLNFYHLYRHMRYQSVCRLSKFDTMFHKCLFDILAVCPMYLFAALLVLCSHTVHKSRCNSWIVPVICTRYLRSPPLCNI